ncbi:MAG: ATP-binding protein [Nitrospirota bacterium]
MGALVLIGWAFDLDAVKSVLPRMATMKANTALALLLAGLALRLSVTRNRNRPAGRIARLCAFVVAMIGLLTLLEYLAGWDFGIDQLLFRDSEAAPDHPFPGRMSQATTFSVFLVGAALFLLDMDRLHGSRIAQLLALVAGYVAFLALIGYGYGVISLYRIGPYSSMAMHTALAMLILSGGLLCARPERGFMALLASDSIGGAMVRRLLPIAFGVTIVIGWLRLQGELGGLYDSRFGVALFAISNVTILALAFWWYAGRLDQSDTERQRAERALADHAEALARSNQELEQFAYVASHDLQEPLRMVSSYTQLLGKRYRGKLDADADEFIHYAVDAASRMQRLINDLLTYSRVGTRGKPLEPTDCDAVLRQVLADLQLVVQESGAVITHDSLPTVPADGAQLAQLFQNLITNAVKFRRDQHAPRIHLSATLKGNNWLFSVRDNGIGIDPRHFDRIFIIFQRLHTGAAHPGTGIGLAICKKIVERHGGRLWVESQPDQGTTFLFTFPRERR